MPEYGNQTDLARLLGISRSAVSQAVRKFDLQLSVDGKPFNLEFAAWQLRQKQDEKRSAAQRSCVKQLPGTRNPKVRREILRTTVQLWDEAIAATIQSRAETSFEDETDKADLENYLYCCMGLWHHFHKIIDREIAPDPGDFDFKKPDCIDFDFTRIPMSEQIEKILKLYPGDNAEQSGKTDYTKTPLDELERLVSNIPDLDLGDG